MTSLLNACLAVDLNVLLGFSLFADALYVISNTSALEHTPLQSVHKCISMFGSWNSCMQCGSNSSFALHINQIIFEFNAVYVCALLPSISPQDNRVESAAMAVALLCEKLKHSVFVKIDKSCACKLKYFKNIFL